MLTITDDRMFRDSVPATRVHEKRRWLFTFAAAAAVLILFEGFSSAQEVTGVRRTGVLVEPLNDNSELCGVTEGALDAAVRLPMAQISRLTVGAPDPTVTSYIYVNVNLMTFGCVAKC